VRWETVAASVNLVAFWFLFDWISFKIRDGWEYWWWEYLFVSLPFFVLCPVLAVIGFRHSVTFYGRTFAASVFLIWLFIPQSWAVYRYLWELIG